MTHGAVLPVYVLDDAGSDPWRWGAAKRWWLHHSLAVLQASLAKLGTQLILRRGAAADIIPALAAEAGADAVFWNRCYEPRAIARDTALKAGLKKEGIAVESFNAGMLSEPWEIATGEGKPYAVFSPFWKALRSRPAPPTPLPAPSRLPAPEPRPRSERLEDWRLLPTEPDWATGFVATGTPGEDAARRRLAEFLDSGLADYAAGRDRPDLDRTSVLSPHLALGEIGPRQIWHAVADTALASPGLAGAAEAYLRELGWREFSYHLLYHAPHLPERNWRAPFDAFPWRDDTAGLRAWQRGQTGYPIVDAGMRQLWRTGWMHNRVRMIVASFLIKDLMIDWRQGQAWFWDTLVDADLANNAASWQWVAGSGADAAPYFRVFNPVLQGRKFDPKGDYVRRFLPELAKLPDHLIHEPWKASSIELAFAGVALGKTYPHPIVDHGQARARALAAYRSLAAPGG